MEINVKKTDQKRPLEHSDPAKTQPETKQDINNIMRLVFKAHQQMSLHLGPAEASAKLISYLEELADIPADDQSLN